jgi:hypothetical protein
LPPVGALDQLRGANGDGIIDRARSNPRIVIAIAAGAVLLLAWIGWAIYVTSSNGATAGLGVVIAWPATLAALALISLPFIGGYLLVKRLSPSDGDAATATADAEPSDEGKDDEDQEDGDEKPEDSAEDENTDSEDEGDSDEDEEEPEPEAKTSKKASSKKS